MKSIMSKISYPMLISIMLTATCIYFIISAFIVSNNNKDTEKELNQTVALVEDSDRWKVSHTDEDKEYYELKEKITQNTSEKKTERLDSFIDSYEEAMNFDVEDIENYKSKQEQIYRTMSVFFTESAFKNTDEYQITQFSESDKIDIDIYPREVFRRYYTNRDDNKTGIFLTVKNKTRGAWEYQEMTVEEKDGSFIITDFKVIDA